MFLQFVEKHTGLKYDEDRMEEASDWAYRANELRLEILVPDELAVPAVAEHPLRIDCVWKAGGDRGKKSIVQGNSQGSLVVIALHQIH